MNESRTDSATDFYFNLCLNNVFSALRIFGLCVNSFESDLFSNVLGYATNKFLFHAFFS